MSGAYDYLYGKYGSDLAFLVDYRTGSKYDLVSGTDGTVVGTPTLTHGELRTPAWSGAGHYVHYGDRCDIGDTTLPKTWVVWVNCARHSVLDMPFSKNDGGGTSSWSVRLDEGSFTIYGSAALMYVRNTMYVTPFESPRLYMCTYDGSKSSAGMTLYVDGVDRSLARFGSITDAAINNTESLKIGGSQFSNYQCQNDTALAAIINQCLTPAQVLELYQTLSRQRPSLSHARRHVRGPCLLDASLRRDGSCPVSTQTLTVGDSVGPWRITDQYYVSGSPKAARVYEDAPSGGRPGKRWVGDPTGTTTLHATTPDDSAFGSWLVEFKTPSVVTHRVEYEFVCNGVRSSTPMLLVQASTNGVVVYKYVTVGGWSVVLDSGVGYLATATTYSIWVSRTPLGVTTLWVRGGAYTTWTQVSAAGGGSNPFTETTITTCQYEAICTIDPSASSRFGDVRHYAEALTPTEAVAKGYIDP